MQIASQVVERSGTVAELEEAAITLGAIPQFNPANGVVELYPFLRPGNWRIGFVTREKAA